MPGGRNRKPGRQAAVEVTCGFPFLENQGLINSHYLRQLDVLTEC